MDRLEELQQRLEENQQKYIAVKKRSNRLVRNLIISFIFEILIVFTQVFTPIGVVLGIVMYATGHSMYWITYTCGAFLFLNAFSYFYRKSSFYKSAKFYKEELDLLEKEKAEGLQEMKEIRAELMKALFDELQNGLSCVKDRK